MLIFQKPEKINSTNIQAEFYRQCVENNISVHLEYKHECSRFDAVVYDKVTKEILFIIEIKSYKVPQRPNVYTKQIYKYRQYNIPVIIVGRGEKVKDAVLFIRRSIDSEERDLPGIIPF